MVIRRMMIFVLLFYFVVHICACASMWNYCDHCKKWANTHNRLISGIDMELCNECYTTYLEGVWDISHLNDG